MGDGGGDMGKVAGAGRFYARRFGKVGAERLRELLRESGEWRCGEVVLATRTEPQLRSIYEEIWSRTLGPRNTAQLQGGTLPGPYPRELPTPEEAEEFVSYRWSPPNDP